MQPTSTPVSLPSLILRGLIGGVLMGLANLVPGISGGTMLLALGIYPLFIAAIADVTTLKFKPVSVTVLGSVVVAAAAAILLLAGPVKELVVEHRWIMYSLFIGLTLGGVPVVWRLARPAVAATWIGMAGGFVGMALLAVSQQAGADGGAAGSGVIMLFIAGLAGAGAMILPGVSGGYVLLVLGQYVPILGAVDRFKDALGAQDFASAFDVGLKVLTPVGLGVVIGIVAISNLLKFLLQRYEKATLGVLLGLLIGAVVGLWPFQQGVAPEIGSLHKGQEVTALTLPEIDKEDYPTRVFTPTPVQVGGALGLILAGFVLTSLLARLDPDRKRRTT
jgi:putative membrane protein